MRDTPQCAPFALVDAALCFVAGIVGGFLLAIYTIQPLLKAGMLG